MRRQVRGLGVLFLWVVFGAVGCSDTTTGSSASGEGESGLEESGTDGDASASGAGEGGGTNPEPILGGGKDEGERFRARPQRDCLGLMEAKPCEIAIQTRRTPYAS